MVGALTSVASFAYRSVKSFIADATHGFRSETYIRATSCETSATKSGKNLVRGRYFL